MSDDVDNITIPSPIIEYDQISNEMDGTMQRRKTVFTNYKNL